jgi:ribosome maturation factor RimP
MAERPNATMDLGLCEALSREYSLLLDVEECIKSEYTLEVSSPGIDRPLTRLKDFERWHGFEAIIDLSEKYEGRRKLKGILLEPIVNADSVSEFSVAIQEETGVFSVPFSKISEAKLVLSDALLKATANGERLHGFAYNDDNAAALSNIEIEIDDKDAVKKMARKNKPKRIEEIEEIVTLETEGK